MSVCDIGTRIRAIRIKKGYTQKYMADQLELTQSNYGRLERNDNRIHIMQLFHICEILGVDINSVLFESNEIRIMESLSHKEILQAAKLQYDANKKKDYHWNSFYNGFLQGYIYFAVSQNEKS